jgi:TonB family protein
MNFSFGPTQSRQVSPSREARRDSESSRTGPTPGPTGNYMVRLEPTGRDERPPGPDWSNELSSWIEAHKYYPRQAAERGEEGTAVVRVTINRNGKVENVELLDRSGSQWLDLSLQALFRDRSVPPFPPDATTATIKVDVEMHYILIR